MKKIKTFEAACKVLNLDPKKLPGTSSLSPKQAAPVIAHFKLMIIAQALNGTWKPDWSDSSQYKWYPWFYMNGPGFRFDHARYDFTTSLVGSRLCFKSEAIATYAGKQFLELYKAYFEL